MSSYPGRVGLIQRVLPHYRAPFFDMLAARCEGGLSVFAGQPRSSEGVHTTTELEKAQYFPARNRHILGGPLYLCWQSGMREWLEGWQPDALIIEANPRYLNSRRAVRWMGEKDGSVIGWGLGTGRGGSVTGKLTRAWRRRFLGQFDALIAYSQEGKRSFADLDLDATQLYHAPNAVVAAPARQAKKKPGKLPRLLFVGRLQRRKGLERLMRASQSLQTELAHEVHIVGDGPERASLEAISDDGEQGTHFTGALFDADLEAEFLGADIFVLPGTGGLAVQQAMSYGLPIIAGEGDGTQRDLLDESNGWQLADDSLNELRQTLRQALADRESLTRKGAASYRRVKEQFNLEQMTEVFVEALNEVSS